MQEMTPAEYRRFMLDTARTGKLATVRADGSPHVTPIWFDLEGDDLIFTSHQPPITSHLVLHFSASIFTIRTRSSRRTATCNSARGVLGARDFLRMVREMAATMATSNTAPATSNG